MLKPAMVMVFSPSAELQLIDADELVVDPVEHQHDDQQDGTQRRAQAPVQRLA
jgi:hypothetical protein